MGMFKNILVRAHHGDKEAVDKLYEQYKPLLRKYSFVNGVFDEDLHHILVIAFLEMIRTLDKFHLAMLLNHICADSKNCPSSTTGWCEWLGNNWNFMN